MRQRMMSLFGPNVRSGSTSEVTETFRNFCFGRKAEVHLRNTGAGLPLVSVLNGSICDFRFTPNNGHAKGDVGYRQIYFRCWSESGRGRKALLTAGIDL